MLSGFMLSVILTSVVILSVSMLLSIMSFCLVSFCQVSFGLKSLCSVCHYIECLNAKCNNTNYQCFESHFDIVIVSKGGMAF